MFETHRLRYFIFSHLSQFDLDHNGHITSAELGNVFQALGESVPGYKLREMIAEVDTDKNGTVEFNEFIEVGVFSQRPKQKIGLPNNQSSQGLRIFWQPQGLSIPNPLENVFWEERLKYCLIVQQKMFCRFQIKILCRRQKFFSFTLMSKPLKGWFQSSSGA